jgi:hypothetical protein
MPLHCPAAISVHVCVSAHGAKPPFRLGKTELPGIRGCFTTVCGICQITGTPLPVDLTKPTGGKEAESAKKETGPEQMSGTASEICANQTKIS